MESTHQSVNMAKHVEVVTELLQCIRAVSMHGHRMGTAIEVVCETLVAVMLWSLLLHNPETLPNTRLQGGHRAALPSELPSQL